jgi:hypothetical protein
MSRFGYDSQAAQVPFLGARMATRPKDPDMGKPSNRVTLRMAREFIRLKNAGWLQSRIAAEFDVNQGRVSEVINGLKWPEAHLPEPPTLFD